MNLYYAVKNKNDLIREQSASGGFFSVIAEYVLNRKGYVYGAALLPKGKVKHIRINNLTDLELLRGSKYVQSDLKGVLNQVQTDVKNGNLVLFTGTPCQCAAVKSVVGDQKNLILADIVCHGVSSPKVFEKYWNMLETQHGKIKKFSFRDKGYTWKQQQWSVEYEDDTKDATSYELKSYKELYYKTILHRKSCFKCPFANLDRKTDFTMGDFWGIENFNKKIIDDKGISLVIIHSENGKKIWNEISNDVLSWKAEEKECLQPQLCESIKPMYQDTKFWDDFNTSNCEYKKVMKKYGWPSVSRRIKDKIKKLLK